MVAREDSIEPVPRSLDWMPDGDDGSQIAQSRVFHDDGGELPYRLHHNHDGQWIATFEGAEIAAGGLEFCVAECAKSENATLEPEVDTAPQSA